MPFTGEKMERVGGLEVRDKKDETVTGFVVDATEFDTYRYVYRDTAQVLLCKYC